MEVSVDLRYDPNVQKWLAIYDGYAAQGISIPDVIDNIRKEVAAVVAAAVKAGVAVPEVCECFGTACVSYKILPALEFVPVKAVLEPKTFNEIIKSGLN